MPAEIIDLTKKPAAVSTPALDKLNIPFSNYEQVAGDSVKALIKAWTDEQNKTKSRRDIRYVNIDIDGEKDSGSLDKDEIFTPIYLIDSNIKAQQSKKAAYLTKSPRVAILSCNEDASVNGEPIEKDFTLKARYNEYEFPLLKWIDGSETHAWDTVEIIFDPEKPGNFDIEHCEHDKLLYPTDTKHLQKADYLIRLIDLTPRDLAKLVRDSNFDPIQVDKVLSANGTNKDSTSSDPILRNFDNKRIEKVFFKHTDGFVYVAWSCAEYCDNWLRAPKKLFLGQVQRNPAYDPAMQNNVAPFIQLYETSYPIEILLYSLSEDECIMRMKGRVDLDEPKQEAATSLLSTALTSFRRSGNLYWTSADGMNDGTSWDEAQTDIKLIPNRVFQKPLKQMQLQHVDVGIFNAVNLIMGQSQQESGDINYAIQSNKSTRKTSAEVKLADKTDTLLSSVGATLLSIALRNVYTRCFNIYRSRVLAGLIKVNETVLDLITKYTWTLKPAGDVDVVERNDKLNKMQQAWPVYQNTPAHNTFLKLLTKLLFPDEAPEIIKEIEAGEMQLKFIAASMEVIKGLIIDPATNSIRQEYASNSPQLIQLLQQGQQIMQSAGGNISPAMESKTGEDMPSPTTVEETQE